VEAFPWELRRSPEVTRPCSREMVHLAEPADDLARRLHVAEAGADQPSLARAKTRLVSARHRRCGGVKGTLAARGGYAALDPVLGLWRTASARAVRTARLS